jgi:hypothetical protein
VKPYKIKPKKNLKNTNQSRYKIEKSITPEKKSQKSTLRSLLPQRNLMRVAVAPPTTGIKPGKDELRTGQGRHMLSEDQEWRRQSESFVEIDPLMVRWAR